MERKTKIFTVAEIFFFAVLVAVFTLYIIYDTVPLKAAASAVFLVGAIFNLLFVLRRRACGFPACKYLFVSAAALCFAGDVVLCFNMAVGIALFGAGHILYIAAFQSINSVGWRTILPAAALSCLSLCVLLLTPAFEFGNLLPAVVIYGLIISCMLGRAAGVALDGTVNAKLRLCAFSGAALFFLSDFFLAVLVFGGGSGVFRVLCLAFYYPAQYLLTLCIYFSSESGEKRVKQEMNVFRRLYCRAFQAAFRIALPLLPYRQPKPLAGSIEAAELLKNKKKRRALIVTDKNIYSCGLCAPVERALSSAGINFSVYAETVANPTVANCRAAAEMYKNDSCDCIIAVGGGSAMDCAKAAGALIIKPRKTLAQMRGVLKVFGKLPLFIAVPTTAGTGSETTIAAVITDDKTRDKFTIISFCLAPHYAILDPEMTVGLPPAVTATTGMDALTHAVEAYIGRSSTRMTRRLSVEAVSIIRSNLYKAYANGSDRQARGRMQYAAYCAGLAFTISYVGYVHAVAHSLGGKYNTPHGLANAVILPYALKRYGVSCRRKLARLARASGVADVTLSDAEAAKAFIAFTEDMNAKMQIPAKLRVEECDIPELAAHADKEGNPLYPVPRLMNAEALEKLYYDIKE